MNVLKRLRAERQLTVRQLSLLSGIGTNTINGLENKGQKARPATLGKLSKALNCTIDDLAELMDQSPNLIAA